MEVELESLTPAAKMAADDSEADSFLRASLSDAVSYLQSFRWCGGVRESYAGLAASGILAVFLCRIYPSRSGIDEWLWVVVGDLPSAFFVTDQARTAAQALEVYCSLMSDWVSAVRSRGPLDEVFPVSAPPTEEAADLLSVRINFIRSEILPLARSGELVVDHRPESEGSAVAPGDLVTKHGGEDGIAIEEIPCPPDDWLKIQRDARMRSQRTSRWWRVLPLSGGSVSWPEGLIASRGPAAMEKVEAALASANEAGKRTLQTVIASLRSGVAPGDLVTNGGKEGIAIEEVPCPPDDWLKIQRDARMRSQRTSRWWEVLPLSGGSVWWPEGLIASRGPATMEKVEAARASANEAGKRTLQTVISSLRKE